MTDIEVYVFLEMVKGDKDDMVRLLGGGKYRRFDRRDEEATGRDQTRLELSGSLGNFLDSLPQ